MHKATSARITVVLLLIGTLAPVGSALAEDASPQLSGNLIKNPGFEDGVHTHDDEGSVKVAVHWTPWWDEKGTSDQKRGYGVRPTFHYADKDVFDYEVKEGLFSQYWRYNHGTSAAGIYQQVTVPQNVRVRFQAFGRGWSCDPESSQSCSDFSLNPTDLNLQIGIDMNGGTNFFASSVVRSPEQNAYDSWQYFVVEDDTGSSNLATIFLKAEPDNPVEWNQIYWDDTYMVVIEAEGPVIFPGSEPPAGGSGGGTTTTTTSPTTPSTTTTTTTPTTTTATGTYTVQPNDSLGDIAKQFGTTVAELIRVNGPTYNSLYANPDVIYTGWVLKLSPAAPDPPIIEIPIIPVPSRTSGSGGGLTVTPSGLVYVVQPNDSLSKIIEMFHLNYNELVALNADTYPSLWTTPDLIYVGWVFRLPL
jgi:LysM repeat protein